jgi:chromosome segregation protein
MEVQARLDGVGSGVRAALNSGDPCILGLVADRIEVPEAYTQAVAALLGARFEDIVVSDRARGLELIGSLRAAKKGRATIVMQSAPVVVGRNAGLGGTRIFSLLKFAAEDTALVQSLVGDARLVDTDEEAEALSRDLQVPVATLGGTLFHADGRVTGGLGEQVAAGILETKRETRELSASVIELEIRVTAALATFHGLREQIADVQTSLERARQEAHQGELALVTSEKDRASTEAELERTNKRLVQTRLDIEALTALLTSAEDERREADRASVNEREALLAFADERTVAQAQVEAQRAVVEQHRELRTQARVELGSRREHLLGARGATTRLTRSIEELELRGARLNEEASSNAMQFGETCAQLFTHKEALVAATEAQHFQELALDAARVEFETVRAELSEREGLLKGLRTEADTSKESLQASELLLREHEMGLGHLIESVREKFRGLELLKVVGEYHLRPPPDVENKQRITELVTLIERMGSVNLEAMKEHAQAEERYAYYTTQKADLDQALADLTRAINQMNRESKRLFKETFDAVNIRFQEIFPKMFRGGGASLRLTNPDDMLETGIDILAQPPGKKISSIELMSGGEKALTAVSLIFAIFQIKPSPFCILDEVDAPLDEANVARYNEMVREMTDRSQFILITHIKRTMQMVDVLYGVTMQEPGVSRLVSVKLGGAQEQVRRKPELAAAVA